MHPCLSCGACCGYFRVSFHWSESLATSFQVPVELTESVTPHLIAMKKREGKCVALTGEIGKNVACSIYENRSSSCRDFGASFEDGIHNERCDKARAIFGLEPLTRADWQ